MNESAGNDIATLYNEMEKYDFNKEFNVTVSIIESDYNVEHSEPHNDNGNNEEIIRSELMDIETRQERYGSDEITSVFFENAHISNKVNENNNNEKSNKSADIQDNSQTNVNFSETDILQPQHRILNSHPPTVYDNTSSSCTEKNVNLNENHNYLDMLSRHMINIIKSYRYFKSYSNNCGDNELSKKLCNENYIHVKERYFRVCCDIVKRIILPMGSNFNVREFLNKTIHIANPSDKNTRTYGDLETIYNEIIASCYRQLSSQEMRDCHNNMNTNVINTGHNLVSQKKSHNCVRRIEPETIHNRYHPILQQNSQNNWHSSMSRISNYRPGNGHHNNTTPTINKGNNSIYLQNSQNNWHPGNITQAINNVSDYGQYNNDKSINNHGNPINMTETMNWHSNNLTQTVNNGPNPAFQENLRNDGHYNIAQTIYKLPNSTLQQNSKNERLMSNIVKPTSNASNAFSQELLRNDSYYYEETQTISNKAISVTDPNYKNNSHLNNVIQKGNKSTNSIINHNLENNQNYNNQPRNSSEVPTTCVFQYKNPNYEVRLDVNTQLLNDVNSTIQVDNTENCTFAYLCPPADDPNHVRQQYSSSDARKSGQATESLNALSNQIPNQDVSQILQEPTRSTSRDSGFMSPCNNQMNDACNIGEVQDSTIPYITNVTSLNPKAVQIPLGACFVCGELTKKKCLGCFKYYYCGHKCQKTHWSRHRFECTDIT